MSSVDPKKTIQMNTTNAICPIGEITGKKNISESKIPVLSCEGACIRGEIARLAANIISRKEPYARGCARSSIQLTKYKKPCVVIN